MYPSGRTPVLHTTQMVHTHTLMHTHKQKQREQKYFFKKVSFPECILKFLVHSNLTLFSQVILLLSYLKFSYQTL